MVECGVGEGGGMKESVETEDSSTTSRFLSSVPFSFPSPPHGHETDSLELQNLTAVCAGTLGQRGHWERGTGARGKDTASRGEFVRDLDLSTSNLSGLLLVRPLRRFCPEVPSSSSFSSCSSTPCDCLHVVYPGTYLSPPISPAAS